MLINKEVEITISGRNLKYYESLGYKIPKYFNKKENKMLVRRGTKIFVKTEDLPRYSHVTILVACDYCGKELEVRNDAYNKQKDSEIPTDCCFDCRGLKNEELNLLKYGVKNQFQRSIIKKKSEKTVLKRYGVKHPMKNNKIVQKSRETLYRNGNVQTSRQQIYIHRSLGGKLNYNEKEIGAVSLDIAFPDEKTFIEYDGSGHNLQVLFGNISQEEFDKKELQRSYFLRRNGWREITIISEKDYIPEKNKLKEMLLDAKVIFNKNRSWVTYNIDNSTIKYNKHEAKYDFGIVKKITERDIA